MLYVYTIYCLSYIFGFSTILTAIVYPISTHWCWGDGGWLSSRGFYDFAGSGVVHVSGGVHALVGKIKKYNLYVIQTSGNEYKNHHKLGCHKQIQIQGLWWEIVNFTK